MKIQYWGERKQRILLTQPDLIKHRAKSEHLLLSTRWQKSKTTRIKRFQNKRQLPWVVFKSVGRDRCSNSDLFMQNINRLLHTDLAWRFSISSSLSRWSLARASLCLRVCMCKVSSAWSSCSFSCSSRAFARWTRVRLSCRRRAICSSLSDESVSSSHTRFSRSNTCRTHKRIKTQTHTQVR